MTNWLAVTVLAAVAVAVASGQQHHQHLAVRQRQKARIDEWIATIRQNPPARSVSPSWSGKSPYSVIGVSNLPLQNEVSAEEEAEEGRPRRRPHPFGGDRRMHEEEGRVRSHEYGRSHEDFANVARERIQVVESQFESGEKGPPDHFDGRPYLSFDETDREFRTQQSGDDNRFFQESQRPNFHGRFKAQEEEEGEEEPEIAEYEVVDEEEVFPSDVVDGPGRGQHHNNPFRGGKPPSRGPGGRGSDEFPARRPNRPEYRNGPPQFNGGDGGPDQSRRPQQEEGQRHFQGLGRRPHFQGQGRPRYAAGGPPNGRRRPNFREESSSEWIEDNGDEDGEEGRRNGPGRHFQEKPLTRPRLGGITGSGVAFKVDEAEERPPRYSHRQRVHEGAGRGGERPGNGEGQRRPPNFAAPGRGRERPRGEGFTGRPRRPGPFGGGGGPGGAGRGHHGMAEEEVGGKEFGDFDEYEDDSAEGREIYDIDEEVEAIPLDETGGLADIEEYEVVDYDALLGKEFKDFPTEDDNSHEEPKDKSKPGGGLPQVRGPFLPHASGFSGFGGNPFLQEEHPEFPRQSFEQAPRGPSRPPSSSEEEVEFKRPPHHRNRLHRPPPSGRNRNRNRGNRPGSEPDLGVNAGFPKGFGDDEVGPAPPRHRPSRHREDTRTGGQDGDFRSPNRQRVEKHRSHQPHSRPHRFPAEDELQRGFKPFFKPSRPYHDDDDEASHKMFGSSEDDRDHRFDDGPVVGLGPPRSRPHTRFPSPQQRDRDSAYNRGGPPRLPLSPVPPPPPQWTTTPRPIPTPGPGDFPPPPPRRPPPPPPTHPTHPPRITHPPGHYKSVFQPPRVDYFPEYEEEEFNDDERLSYERTSHVSNELPFPRDPFKTTKSGYDNSRDRGSEDDEGFFSMPESFPSLATLGAGFESMKIRSKRSAEPDVMRVRGGGSGRSAVSRRRQQLRRQLLKQQQKQQHRQAHRRQGEFGFQQDFWDDVDDVDFFGDGFGQRRERGSRRGQYRKQREREREREQELLLRHHQEQLFREQQLQQRQRQFEPLTTGPRRQRLQQLQRLNRNGSARDRRHRDPYPQSSIQSYPPYGNTDFGGNSLEESRDNEILGSGNFDVIKGGTFYDADTFYHTRYNSRPQHFGDGEDGDFFENFRDFADIKNDLYRNRNFY